MKNVRKYDYPENLYLEIVGNWERLLNDIDYHYSSDKEEQNKLVNKIKNSIILLLEKGSFVGFRSREIIKLYFKDKLNTNEIADVYDISVSKVSNRINEILSNIRYILNLEHCDFEELRNITDEKLLQMGDSIMYKEYHDISFYVTEYEYPENIFRSITFKEYSNEIGEKINSIIQNSKDISDNNREIVKLYFINKLNTREIAEKINLSRSRISQILYKTIRQLRNLVFIDDGIDFWTINGMSMDFIKKDNLDIKIQRTMVRHQKYKTFGNILNLSSREELKNIPNIGNGSIDRIIEHFEYLGINVDRFK